MLDPLSYEVQCHYRRDRMREARQHRLLRPSRSNPLIRFYHWLLAKLGNWLVVYGCRLQTYSQPPLDQPHPAC